MIRTGGNALSATAALSRVNHRNAVSNRNCVIIANRCAVAVAVTAEAAFALAVVEFLNSGAGLCSCECKSVLSRFFTAVAGHIGYLTDKFSALGTHYCVYLLHNIRSARLTQVSRCAVMSYGGGIACTARITASAAVCTGKCLGYLCLGFICLYSQHL